MVSCLEERLVEDEAPYYDDYEKDERNYQYKDKEKPTRAFLFVCYNKIMFSKKQRLNSVLFSLTFNQGKKIHSDGFFIAYKDAADHTPAKFTVVVPKKVEKSAVRRNKFKRKALHYIKELDLPEHGVYVVVYKKLKAPYQELDELFKKLK